MENTNDLKFHKHISSKHNLFDLRLKEVFKYKDLIVLFTKRDFKVSYKQTILGPAWLFLTPLISSLIYAFVFGGIAGIGTDGVPQILFYLAGNAIWTYFAACFTNNASTFTANSGIFGKVYFPRLVTPISNVISAIIRFGIQMLLVLVFLVFYCIKGAVSPNWVSWLFIPVILVNLGLLGMGIGIIFSSVTTKYRDLTILVTFGVQLWMYLTPVIYPISELGEGIMKYILLSNPVTAPIEAFRYAVLGQGHILVGSLIWSWVVSIVVTILGIVIFNKVEKTFMDTV